MSVFRHGNDLSGQCYDDSDYNIQKTLNCIMWKQNTIKIGLTGLTIIDFADQLETFLPLYVGSTSF